MCYPFLLICEQIAMELEHVKLEGKDKDDPMFRDWHRVSEDEWTDFRRKSVFFICCCCCFGYHCVTVSLIIFMHADLK